MGIIEDDIKIFDDFWEKRDMVHTPKNWAVMAFHLGVVVQKLRAKVAVDERKPCFYCPSQKKMNPDNRYCGVCGRLFS